ncbi:hypothetical protein TKWG_09280 [Advenella kashmirensis WT001]|uniref:Quercetin 2,3-dioxygenase C-terminal cupin domain-containing protein n=1 Tax=Advenella kashmirensis (strain DSM 17095 / LMG 22695 / WT001) TaxID=1036672 RepID=I3UAZ4_ADVKW|nr:hypothetical protein [Advenella kashmirensis]AFK62182.1 hypothetical protein TKWG_09280 [Advenella kashmirensis WT001]
MIEIGIFKESLKARTAYTGEDGTPFAHKTVIIGPTKPTPSAPNAYLVEQAPLTTLPVHFHGYGQFQIIVDGAGKLGRHDLRVCTAHYAGQQTAYGPLRSGERGLSYLTLRAATEGAAFFMPAASHYRNPNIPRFERFGVEGALSNDGVIQTLLPEDTLGLGAWLLTVPEGQSVASPLLNNGSGRFYVVLDGVWQMNPRLTRLDIVWTDANEAPLEIVGGQGGLKLMIVQFPANACEIPHPAPERPQNTKING